LSRRPRCQPRRLAFRWCPRRRRRFLGPTPVRGSRLRRLFRWRRSKPLRPKRRPILWQMRIRYLSRPSLSRPRHPWWRRCRIPRSPPMCRRPLRHGGLCRRSLPNRQRRRMRVSRRIGRRRRQTKLPAAMRQSPPLLWHPLSQSRAASIMQRRALCAHRASSTPPTSRRRGRRRHYARGCRCASRRRPRPSCIGRHRPVPRSASLPSICRRLVRSIRRNRRGIR
jgi:hypothetical protein